MVSVCWLNIRGVAPTFVQGHIHWVLSEYKRGKGRNHYLRNSELNNKPLHRYSYAFTHPPRQNVCTLPLHQNVTQSQCLSGPVLIWIQSFPFPRPVAEPRLKSPICPVTNPWRTDEIMPFSAVLARSETETASYRNWARFVVSIALGDNRYATRLRDKEPRPHPVHSLGRVSMIVNSIQRWVSTSDALRSVKQSLRCHYSQVHSEWL